MKNTLLTLVPLMLSLMASSAADQPAPFETPVLLENDQVAVEIDSVLGRINRILDKQSGIGFSSSPELAGNFRLELGLPGNKTVTIPGREQYLTEVTRRSGWIGLGLRVTFGMNGQCAEDAQGRPRISAIRENHYRPLRGTDQDRRGWCACGQDVPGFPLVQSQLANEPGHDGVGSAILLTKEVLAACRKHNPNWAMSFECNWDRMLQFGGSTWWVYDQPLTRSVFAEHASTEGLKDAYDDGRTQRAYPRCEAHPGPTTGNSFPGGSAWSQRSNNGKAGAGWS